MKLLLVLTVITVNIFLIEAVVEEGENAFFTLHPVVEITNNFTSAVTYNSHCQRRETTLQPDRNAITPCIISAIFGFYITSDRKRKQCQPYIGDSYYPQFAIVTDRTRQGGCRIVVPNNAPSIRDFFRQSIRGFNINFEIPANQTIQTDGSVSVLNKSTFAVTVYIYCLSTTEVLIQPGDTKENPCVVSAMYGFYTLEGNGGRVWCDYYFGGTTYHPEFIITRFSDGTCEISLPTSSEITSE